MKRIVQMLIVVLLVSTGVSSQKANDPKFSSFPATVGKAHAKAIDFRRSPGASTYRTRLTEALSRGVNFAGHCILTGWGCGTGCTNGAIIDARNGVVYFPDELAGVSGYDETFEFRKNSRLLIINGSPDREMKRMTESLPGSTTTSGKRINSDSSDLSWVNRTSEYCRQH